LPDPHRAILPPGTVLATRPIVTTLEKICIVALAAFWLASAAWPDGEKEANAASGGSAPMHQVPPLP
jgi:hypothetical protein